MNAKEIVNQLNIDQLLSLLTGKDFWNVSGINEFNLKPITLTDGPHGLRKQAGNHDQIGLSSSIPSTCFPTASCLASSWNLPLIEKMGQALGESCLKEDVSVILGPGTNIKRHPLGGRNFEYFSEDPLLSGKISESMIQGIQSRGVGACLKHYAVNNQEYRRMTINAIVDERTLRELYLKPFEIAIKKSKPWMLMSSYNLINGEYASEHNELLSQILREEWKYEGVVVTDWGANNDPIKALKNGLNLEMPANKNISIPRIKKALKNHEISEEIIKQRAEKILDLLIKANQIRDNFRKDVDTSYHHDLAREIASESIILLKNDHDTLPLNHHQKVLLVGGFAKKPRYQGSGSSLIQPLKLTNLFDEFKKTLRDQLKYARGYDLNSELINQDLIDEALLMAEEVDIIFLMVGLPEIYESEGFDRDNLELPLSHQILIQKLSTLSIPLVLCLSNGGPVKIPGLDKVDAVIEQYLSGEAGAEALSDIVFGRLSPSGKLAETFPNELDELISNDYFPGNKTQVEYRESFMIGYCNYDIKDLKPMFPFGYGLSYTKFIYENFSLYNDIETNKLRIKGQIKNIGKYDGKEIVQVYVSKENSKVLRPIKSLKAFGKYMICKGESIDIELVIDYEDLAIYQNDYLIESGEYKVLIGSSSQEIHETFSAHVFSNDKLKDENYHMIIDLYKQGQKIDDSAYQEIYKGEIPTSRPIKPYHINTTLGDVSHLWIGRLLYKMVHKQMKKVFTDTDLRIQKMIEKSIEDMPLRSLMNYSQGKLSLRKTKALIDLMNKSYFSGLIKLILG